MHTALPAFCPLMPPLSPHKPALHTHQALQLQVVLLLPRPKHTRPVELPRLLVSTSLLLHCLLRLRLLLLHIGHVQLILILLLLLQLPLRPRACHPTCPQDPTKRLLGRLLPRLLLHAIPRPHAVRLQEAAAAQPAPDSGHAARPAGTAAGAALCLAGAGRGVVVALEGAVEAVEGAGVAVEGAVEAGG